MFRFKGYFESYLIFNTRKSLSMLLWEGHRPQLLPINLRTHARGNPPTPPVSAKPAPHPGNPTWARSIGWRWLGGAVVPKKKKETEKKKKKKRRQPRWTCVICECASHSQAFSRGARVPAAAASRHRCRARGALAVGPTHGGGGGPHWTVTVTWLSRSMRRDTTVAMRKLFFFFHFFTAPRRRTRWSVSAGDWASIWLFYYGGVFACIFSFFTMIRRRRRGGGIRRDRVWTFARRSLFARRRWVVNVPDSYVSGLTYIDDRTSTKLYTTMVLLLQRS